MQMFLVGLLLAGISATSVVAFRHPHGYAKLFPYLVFIVTTLFVALTLWQVAVELTWRGLADFVEPQHMEAAEVSKRKLSLPYLQAFLAYVGSVAFFWVNLRLPGFLRIVEDDPDAAKGPH